MGRFHDVEQDVLMRISRIVEGPGAGIAFLTRTQHVAPGTLEAAVRAAGGAQAATSSGSE